MAHEIVMLQPVLLSIPDVGAPPRVRVLQQRHYARLALQACARQSGAPENGWAQNADGVPQPQGRFHWSISHKRSVAAAVIATRPVGIDVELLTPRRAALFGEIADAEEWKRMDEEDWAAFYRMWTAKEAILKAKGVGIAGLSRCRLLDVENATHMLLDYAGERFRVEHYLREPIVACVTCHALPVRWSMIAETVETV